MAKAEEVTAGQGNGPPNACDTHMHFYDERFPASPAAVLRPPDASPDDYRLVQRELGLKRVVVVQPTTYGLDNACQLEAMATFGESARGVVVIDHETPASELVELTDLGVRGARFHMLPGGAVEWDIMLDVASNIALFGWHIQLQLNGRDLVDRLDILHRLPCPLVVDHVGRFMPPVPEDHPAFSALTSLVDDGAMVKLSAPYESSTEGPPEYPDVSPLVDALVARAPDRMLWATNWPHPARSIRRTWNCLQPFATDGCQRPSSNIRYSSQTLLNCTTSSVNTRVRQALAPHHKKLCIRTSPRASRQ